MAFCLVHCRKWKHSQLNVLRVRVALCHLPVLFTPTHLYNGLAIVRHLQPCENYFWQVSRTQSHDFSLSWLKRDVDANLQKLWEENKVGVWRAELAVTKPTGDCGAKHPQLQRRNQLLGHPSTRQQWGKINRLLNSCIITTTMHGNDKWFLWPPNFNNFFSGLAFHWWKTYSSLNSKWSFWAESAVLKRTLKGSKLCSLSLTAVHSSVIWWSSDWSNGGLQQRTHWSFSIYQPTVSQNCSGIQHLNSMSNISIHTIGLQ